MNYTHVLDFIDAFSVEQANVYETAQSKGWYENGSPNEGERIALMHSELSEALEAIRKDPDKPSEHIPAFSGLEEELADVVIRIMDFAQHKNLKIAQAVLAKAAFNRTRPHRHGGKKF